MADQAGISRRDFIRTAAVVGTLPTFGILTAEGKKKKEGFKVALIGCGGRGKGALGNCFEAAKKIGIELKLVATADAFEKRSLEAGKPYSLDPERCFYGFDAYKKALETDAEVVVMATPPNFRPVHFEASINAGKHVFMEKPVAVDPPGARRIMAAGKVAGEKGLSVVAGTQRRHQNGYLRNQFAIEHGAIGRIVGGTILWCGGRLWFKTQEEGEDDASYLVRNWVSFTEMSGDHIVEQHVHNIDVANWFIGHPPQTAIGFGGRARRQTGNQFDFFSIDFDYGDECHIHSMCRQVNGCYGRVSEHFTGTQGSAWGNGKLKSELPSDIDVPDFKGHDNAYVQEHIDLLNSILAQKPINEAQNVAEATLTGIMGRISAYTGQLIRWKDLTENKGSPYYKMTLGPSADDFEKGPVAAPEEDAISIPGQA